ncbi:MAB_1171c family putative transporter [Streptacidiphilus sp. MAP5-52]|uniref:MAB_1171c family putative transporter n=1 Tax=Streptacidiphilus sp. MAP5-52 TaxID=3156267 RepID=UPI003514F66A
MITFIYSVLPVLMLGATAYWARGGRAARTPGAWSMVLFIGCFAVAFGTYSPLGHGLAEAIASHFAHVVSNSATLAAGAAVMSFLLVLNAGVQNARRRMRPRLAALAATVTVMVITFLLTPPSGRWAEDVGGHHVEPLTMTVYSITYSVYLSFAVADCLVQTWIHARTAPRTSLRVGLRMTALGCLLTLTYTAYKIYDAIATFTDTGGSRHYARCTSAITPIGCAMGVTVPALAVLLILIGLTMPVIVWKLRQVQRVRWERQAIEDLDPLWAAIVDAVPHVVLTLDGGSQTSDYQLHRRVIEISDGILSTFGHRSPQVSSRAKREIPLDTRDRAARVEAAVLLDALDGRRTGRPEEFEPAPLAAGTTERDSDLRAEVEWLRSVAKALRSTGRPEPQGSVR